MILMQKKVEYLRKPTCEFGQTFLRQVKLPRDPVDGDDILSSQ